MCKSIINMCQVIEREQHLDRPLHPDLLLPKKGQIWNMPLCGGIFNILEFLFSLGCVHESRKEKGMDLPTKQQAMEFFVALFVPFVAIYKIYTSRVIDPKQKNKTVNLLMSAVYATCYIGWIVLFCFGGIVKNYGFAAFGMALCLINAIILCSLRMQFRAQLGIHGNMIGDFIAASILYPQALTQMVIELNNGDNVSVSAIDDGKHDD